jgi:hypothetical protein
MSIEGVPWPQPKLTPTRLVTYAHPVRVRAPLFSQLRK